MSEQPYAAGDRATVEGQPEPSRWRNLLRRLRGRPATKSLNGDWECISVTGLLDDKLIIKGNV